MGFNPDALTPDIRPLYDYWQGLRPSAGHYPARRQISPTDLKPFLPYVSLIEKRPPEGDYFYRLMGTGFTTAIGFDASGRKLMEMLPLHILEPLIEELETTERTGQPHARLVTIRVHGDELRSYNRLILPLADDGATINMFMVYGCPQDRPGVARA